MPSFLIRRHPQAASPTFAVTTRAMANTFADPIKSRGPIGPMQASLATMDSPMISKIVWSTRIAPKRPFEGTWPNGEPIATAMVESIVSTMLPYTRRARAVAIRGGCCKANTGLKWINVWVNHRLLVRVHLDSWSRRWRQVSTRIALHRLFHYLPIISVIEVPKPIKPQVQPARVNSYAISSSLPRANPIPSVSFAPTGTMIYHSSYSARSNFSRTQTMRERVTTTTSNGGVPSIVQPSIISRPVPIENSFTRPSVSYQPLPGATSYRPAAAPVNRVTVTETEITEEEPAEEPPTRVHSVPVTSYRPAAHQPIEVPVSVNVPVPVNVKPSRVFESIVPIDCLECLCQVKSQILLKMSLNKFRFPG